MKNAVSSCRWMIASAIAGAAVLARVALALPPNSGGSSGVTLPPEPGGGIDCASFVTGTISAEPTKIKFGESATLRWSVDIPERCTAKGITVNSQPVGKQGSMTLQSPRTRTYELKQDAKTLGTAQLEVDYPPRVIINESISEPVTGSDRCIG